MVEGSSSVGYYSSLLTSIEFKALSNIVPQDKSTWENLTFPDDASTYNFYKSYATQADFNVEHCHLLHPKEHSHLLHPNINPIQAVVVVVNVEAGIPNRSSFELFSRMTGGVEKVGFRPIDLKTFFSTVRQLKLEDGEGS
ncbi:hypothetical protein LIER_41671 [Lithospermum erythrorhizon]|uniref:Uncharacterized protein n=1 Tax=Lithospermum erythrorhizon TaxID=34254 RepID=A0AAV3RCL3_LITER